MDVEFGICQVCWGKIFRSVNRDGNITTARWKHFKEDVLHAAVLRDPIMNCMSRRYTTGWCIISPDTHKRHFDGKYYWGGYVEG